MGQSAGQRVWCRDRWLDLAAPVVMGVINVTPDSFSDGGRFLDPQTRIALDNVVSAARQMLDEGASILDIGGESTRPGADPVDEATECSRVIPVVERLVGLGSLLSVDTRKATVAERALAAGAHFVNDISAGADPDMLRLVAQHGAGLCLMHMQGVPATMQTSPEYVSVCDEVCGYLERRAGEALAAGVRREQIVLDPGIGFGKSLDHNLELIRGMEQLAALGFPVMIGVSRKSSIGRITGRGVNERLAGSLAMAVLAAERGARIIRVHDVAATVDAIAVQQAVRRATN